MTPFDEGERYPAGEYTPQQVVPDGFCHGGSREIGTSRKRTLFSGTVSSYDVLGTAQLVGGGQLCCNSSLYQVLSIILTTFCMKK